MKIELIDLQGDGDIDSTDAYRAYSLYEIQQSYPALVTLTTSGITNPYLFTGQPLDTIDSGGLYLYHYRDRIYEPLHARFLQRDFFVEYDDGMNLYQYVANSPTNYTDFNGHQYCCFGPGCCGWDPRVSQPVQPPPTTSPGSQPSPTPGHPKYKVSFSDCNRWMCCPKGSKSERIFPMESVIERDVNRACENIFRLTVEASYKHTACEYNNGDKNECDYWFRMYKMLQCMHVNCINGVSIKCGGTYCKDRQIIAYIYSGGSDKRIRLCCLYFDQIDADRHNTICHELSHLCGSLDPYDKDHNPIDLPDYSHSYKIGSLCELVSMGWSLDSWTY